jgi:hypothetical protein
LEINCVKTVYSLFTLGIDVLKVSMLTIDGQELRQEQNPVYLGVTLDWKLSMYDHVRVVKENATSKLSIVKRLASTGWGAKASVLRTLYLGAVRSQMEYSLPVQIYASKTALETLDNVQNHALRLICGTFRTTPTAAVEIMANVPPLRLHRQKAVITAYERYKRLEESCPLRMMVDSWEENDRIQMRSFMHHATGLCARIALPGDRMPLRGVGFPLDSSPYLPKVRMHMTDPTVGKHSSLAERLAIALETVNTSSDCIKCYTNCSASDVTAHGGKRRSGYGVRVL